LVRHAVASVGVGVLGLSRIIDATRKKIAERAYTAIADGDGASAATAMERMAHVWVFDGAVPVRILSFAQPADALAAAGLDPEGMRP
jgi:hypothetical protein